MALQRRLKFLEEHLCTTEKGSLSIQHAKQWAGLGASQGTSRLGESRCQSQGKDTNRPLTQALSACLPDRATWRDFGVSLMSNLLNDEILHEVSMLHIDSQNFRWGLGLGYRKEGRKKRRKKERVLLALTYEKEFWRKNNLRIKKNNLGNSEQCKLKADRKFPLTERLA